MCRECTYISVTPGECNSLCIPSKVNHGLCWGKFTDDGGVLNKHRPNHINTHLEKAVMIFLNFLPASPPLHWEIIMHGVQEFLVDLNNMNNVLVNCDYQEVLLVWALHHISNSQEINNWSSLVYNTFFRYYMYIWNKYIK